MRASFKSLFQHDVHSLLWQAQNQPGKAWWSFSEVDFFQGTAFGLTLPKEKLFVTDVLTEDKIVYFRETKGIFWKKYKQYVLSTGGH